MAEINRGRLERLFLELVQIDSLSRREGKLAARLKAELEGLGARCQFDSAAARTGGETGNLIGHLDGSQSGAPALLLCAHMDTVAPGENVKPVVVGDIIRSDGSTVLGGDDKAGCAVICEALHQVRERAIAHGPIDVVFTVCEEAGLMGARHLDLSLVRAREGLVLDGDSPGCLFVRAPAAQGLRFRVTGLEAHAGMCPERGISALEVAAEAIAAMRLGRVDAETTANLGVISGGRAANVLPGEIVIRGEARSRDAGKLKAQVDHMVACFRQAAERTAIELDGKTITAGLDYSVFQQYGALDLPDDAPIVRKVVEAARRAGRLVIPAATGGGCDANVLNGRGLSVANLGTGMRDIHTVREWLDLNDMVAAAAIAVELIKLQAG